MSNKWLLVLGATGALAAGLVACGDDKSSSTGATGGSDGASGLSGAIRIDGSSTVAPITEAIAELFNEQNPDAKVTVGTSGTGGGFEKFCAGETDINDASRQIEDDEVKACGSKNIKFDELQVANDALTVVVNPANPVECLTVDQLKQIWGPKSTVKSWSEVTGLEPSFGADLVPYTPGSDSGTFDYFTGAINGEEGDQRPDANDVGEDDNATVQGVSGAEGAIGYFGFSYFQENEGTVKALQIDGGQGCVSPSVETAQDGSYTPLARGLYVYASADAIANNKLVDEFLGFYLDNVNSVAEKTGFIGLTDEQLAASQAKLATLKQG